jgi:hypothetical protein
MVGIRSSHSHKGSCGPAKACPEPCRGNRVLIRLDGIAGRITQGYACPERSRGNRAKAVKVIEMIRRAGLLISRKGSFGINLLYLFAGQSLFFILWNKVKISLDPIIILFSAHKVT